MALKVPIYENQVSENGAPALNLPPLGAPPPAAFGTDLAQRTEQLGNTIGKLGDVLAAHVQERNRQAQQAQIIAADTKFRQDLQDTMFSTEPDPDKDGIAKGVLNRPLAQAAGATVDFDNQYQALKQKYLSQFDNPVQQKDMAKLMDENYTHHRQFVIHHEAEQGRENEKNIIEGNLKQIVANAGSLTDPNQFSAELDRGHLRQYANMKENGFDDASIASAGDKFANEMAKSAILPQISPDPTKAMTFLNSIKNNLTPDNVADLSKFIEVQSRQLDELQKHEKEQGYDANMRTAMLDMFDGKLTLSEAERRFREDNLKKSDYDILESKLVKPDYQILREMTVSDPDTFNQVRQTQLEGTKSTGEISRMIAQGNAAGKITGDDAKYLDKMTKNTPPDPRDQEISAQAQSVHDFANRYFKENVLGVQVNKDETDKNVKDLVSDFYKRVDKEGAQGERIGQIGNEVMGAFVKKRYPEVGQLKAIPHVVVTIGGKVDRLLNPSQKTGLKGQYKITKTGAEDTIESNGKIQAPDEGGK